MTSINKRTLLWLDDYRDPFLNTEKLVPVQLNLDIKWVVNYEEFVEWIKENGLPAAISYDHDLADEHYTPEEYWDDYTASKKYQDSKTYTEKTGLDCVKFIIEYIMDTNIPEEDMPLTFVHSANPVGADNIRLLWRSFIRQYYK